MEHLIGESWLERTDKGVRVPEDSLRSILDQLFEVRLVLERLCARPVAERALPRHL